MAGTVGPGDSEWESSQFPGTPSAIDARHAPGEDPGQVLTAIPPLRARLLGPGTILRGHTVLTARDWTRRPSRSILLMLLGTPGHRLPRDAVIEAIWPAQDLAASLNALYKALHALRRTLEPTLRQGRESAYIDIRNDTITRTQAVL